MGEKEFRQKLRDDASEGEDISFNEIKTTENEIIVTNEDFPDNGGQKFSLEFINIKSKIKITIKDCDRLRKIEFRNSRAELVINNSSLELVSVNNSKLARLHIEKSKLASKDHLEAEDFEENDPKFYSIIITDKSEVSDFFVYRSEISRIFIKNSRLLTKQGGTSTYSLRIKDSEINVLYLLSLISDTSKPNIKVDSCILNQILLNGLEGIDRITIASNNKTSRIGEIKVYGQTDIGTLSITSAIISVLYLSTFDQIEHPIKIGAINIKKTTITEDFTIHKTAASKLAISEIGVSDSTVQNMVWQPINTYPNQDIPHNEHNYSEEDVVKTIRFKNVNIKNGLINGNFNIGKLQFEHVLENNCMIQISDTSIHELTFKNFINLGHIQLINCYHQPNTMDGSKLAVINSDLGKLHMYGCDFGNQQKEIEFENSRILDISIIGNKLPWKIKSTGKGGYSNGQTRSLTEKRNQTEQQLQLLAQYRKVYENNNDISTSMQYHAQYLDYLRQQTSYFSSPKGFFDRLSLSLNRLSSFYGDNLALASITTLGVGILLYIWYFSTRGYLDVKGDFDWDVVKYLVAHFFEFLSPVRKVNFIPPAAHFNNPDFNVFTEVASSHTVFASGISKIIITYLAYQFIQAFRKYGRK